MEVNNDGDGDLEDVNMVSIPEVDGQIQEEPANKRIAQAARTARDRSVDMTDDAQPASSQPNPRSPLAGMPPISARYDQIDEEIPPLQEQVARIESLAQDMALAEGAKGYIISNEWIEEVQNGGDKSSHRQRLVDNRPLLQEIGVDLKDENGEAFFPLKPGLTLGTDIQILPQEAWELILKWHKMESESPSIVRYCHNTSTGPGSENLQFELYPPIFTIMKLPDNGRAVTLMEKTAKSVKLATSRSLSFQTFLRDAKGACRIPLESKVRVWRILDLPTNGSQSMAGMMTPAQSREVSPAGDVGNALILDTEKFVALHYGSQRELVDAKDETNNSKYNGSSTIDLVGLGQEGMIVLEPQIGGPAGGEWPSETVSQTSKKGLLSTTTTNEKAKNNSDSGRSSPALQGVMTRGRAQKNGRTRGTIGLGNLGNTCYMNSALQCVRSVKELTDYFLDDRYKKELNPTNPLAHKGEVAKAYANLLKEIYNSSSSHSFSPRQFKATIGKYGPSFSGYGQQDSQEFLLFLLDGLQEDLNRIHKKPYIEKPDSTDEMVHNEAELAKFADTCWDIYKARNDSVITDLFAGMYKSTVTCPICNKVSIIFDPFNNLTLQLPIESVWSRKMSFYPLNLRPIDIQVEIDKNSTIAQLTEYIGKKVSVDPKRLIVAEIYQHRYYKYFDPSVIIGEERIQPQDEIAIIEVEEIPTNYPPLKRRLYRSFPLSMDHEDDIVSDEDGTRSDRLLVPVFHRASKEAASSRMGSDKILVAEPTFIVLNKEEAKDLDMILKKVLARVATMTTRDILEESYEQTQDEDTDMVVMSNDTDSSSESRIQTVSVQGEEGMVDISMKDREEPNDDLYRSYPPRPKLHKPLPEMLQSKGYLVPELRRLFEMKYFKSQEAIPTTLNTFNDGGKRLPPLDSRLPQRPSKRAPGEKLKQAITNGDFSEDELDSPQPARARSPKNSISGSDEDEDELPEVQPPSKALNSGSSSGRLKRRQRGMKRRNKLIVYSRKGSTFTSDNDLDVFNTRAEEPLIRMGEGIVLDWYDDAFDALFGGDAEGEARGAPVWKEQKLLLPDPEQDKKSLLRKRRQKDGVSLDDCLDEFGKEEILSENDAWYCPKCKEHRRASKKFELWKVPDILVIHLKRFSASRGLRDKLDLFVDFPTEGLDLSTRVAINGGRDLTYDLFAVDNHYGGLGGGHYTAFAQSFYDKCWYEYNDSMASKRNDPKSAVTSAAYLLFYRRRSEKPLGGQFFENIYADIDSLSEAADSQLRSRTQSPSSQAGEGRRLGDSSRINGSSSAYHEAEVVHQAGGGGLETEGMTLPTINFEDELPGYSEIDHSDVPLNSMERDDAKPILHINDATWGFGRLGDDSASVGSNSSTAVNRDGRDDSPTRSVDSGSGEYPSAGKQGTPEVADLITSSGPTQHMDDDQPVANITLDEDDTNAVMPSMN